MAARLSEVPQKLFIGHSVAGIHNANGMKVSSWRTLQIEAMWPGQPLSDKALVMAPDCGAGLEQVLIFGT